MKQLVIKTLKGKIKVETGLHIGAGNDVIEIGGMDNPIIRNPKTKMPYIPGSSIKGKMRSLMEWKLGKVEENNGKPCSCGKCVVCRVFGVSAANKTEDKELASKRGPTRLIVRDAELSNESMEAYDKNGVPLIEEKHENTINRITAEANPRPIERVVPGTLFDFEISYRVLDTENDDGKKDEQNFKEVVLKSLALLQLDYLGGGGSRGNGKISFIDLKDENGNDVQLPEVV